VYTAAGWWAIGETAGSFQRSADSRLRRSVSGQHSAESIPGARLVTLEDGGHLLVGHREELLTETTSFLEAQLGETGDWE
jgi:hypothetical protein